MSTSTATPRFGQTVADDVVLPSGDAQWIRTFKDPSTQIRICPAERVKANGETVYGYHAWLSELEHYDEDIQLSYPCVNTREHGNQECQGCKSESKRVRDRSRRYYVNALEEDGTQRIYKFGPVVYDVFKMRQDRANANDPENDQPLSDRDYIINKSGSGLKTKYDVESGEKYEVEWPEEFHDIGEALSAAWTEAMNAYNGDEALGDGSDDDEPQSARGRIGGAAKKATAGSLNRAARERSEDVEDDEPARPAAKKTAAKKTTAASRRAAKEETEAEPVGDVTIEDIEDMATPEIREWVEKHAPSIEIPPKAPRSKLVQMAQNLIDGEPPF